VFDLGQDITDNSKVFDDGMIERRRRFLAASQNRAVVKITIKCDHPHPSTSTFFQYFRRR
jgi:hypothetical protein